MGFIHLHEKDLNRDDVNKIYFILSSYQDHLDSTNCYRYAILS